MDIKLEKMNHRELDFKLCAATTEEEMRQKVEETIAELNRTDRYVTNIKSGVIAADKLNDKSYYIARIEYYTEEEEKEPTN